MTRQCPRICNPHLWASSLSGRPGSPCGGRNLLQDCDLRVADPANIPNATRQVGRVRFAGFRAYRPTVIPGEARNLFCFPRKGMNSRFLGPEKAPAFGMTSSRASVSPITDFEAKLGLTCQAQVVLALIQSVPR